MKVISEINGSGLYAQSALSASTASYDSLGNEITATYATKSEIPSLDGLMETDKLEFDSNNKITAYNGSAFAGQGGIAEVVTSEPITGNGTTESPIGAETIEIESINLEAGEGIDITDGVISVTATGGKTYEGVAPIIVDNEENKISADTIDVNYQEITHDDSLVHTSNNAQYALGVNVQYFSPEYGKEKFCGYWNGKPLYHRLYSGTFVTSNGSYQTQDVITTDLSTAYTFQCIDPQNSFIWYAGAAKIPAVSWCLGENRYGGSVISKNQGFYRVECRGVDNAAHQCSAYICFRYTKETI